MEPTRSEVALVYIPPRKPMESINTYVFYGFGDMGIEDGHKVEARTTHEAIIEAIGRDRIKLEKDIKVDEHGYAEINPYALEREIRDKMPKGGYVLIDFTRGRRDVGVSAYNLARALELLLNASEGTSGSSKEEKAEYRVIPIYGGYIEDGVYPIRRTPTVRGPVLAEYLLTLDPRCFTLLNEIAKKVKERAKQGSRMERRALELVHLSRELFRRLYFAIPYGEKIRQRFENVKVRGFLRAENAPTDIKVLAHFAEELNFVDKPHGFFGLKALRFYCNYKHYARFWLAAAEFLFQLICNELIDKQKFAQELVGDRNRNETEQKWLYRAVGRLKHEWDSKNKENVRKILEKHFRDPDLAERLLEIYAHVSSVRNMVAHGSEEIDKEKAREEMEKWFKEIENVVEEVAGKGEEL